MDKQIEGTLHIDRYIGDDEEEERRKKKLEKATPRPLYVSRPVLNGGDIIDWAKAQGFKTTVPEDELHTTIAYSRRAVDWMKMGESYGQTLVIPPGGPRVVQPLGPGGAVVLMFNSAALARRHLDMRRDGASWDYSEYQPHITITWDAGDLDVSKITPYQGEIVLGPEKFAPINEDWKDNLVEKGLYEMLTKAGARHSRADQDMLQAIHDNSVNLGASCDSETDDEAEKVDATVVKVDKNLGLVFGWAIICKKDGEDYYDLNIDKSGERVPEHIPESSMLAAASDFMENGRVAKEMHNGKAKGSVVFAFPLTTEIAKAMGIKTKVTGLMIAMKPSKELLKKFASGELKGFSIGGKRLTSKMLDIEE